MPNEITSESVFVSAHGLVTSVLEEQTVILHVESGTYFQLDEVGTRIWDLLQEPRSAGALCDSLLVEYDIARDECERDVIALLDELAKEGLIESCGGDAGASPVG